MTGNFRNRILKGKQNMKNSLNIQFQKCLLLLDKNRNDEAKEMLLQIISKAAESGDELNSIRSCAVLGEVYFLENDFENAKKYLQEAVIDNEDFDDLLDFEKNQAKETLEKIKTAEILIDFMQKVKINLEIIYIELKKRGYQFQTEVLISSDFALQEPLKNHAELLTKLQTNISKFGCLPLSLRYFYQIVGSVNFCWDINTSEDCFWEMADPLQVFSLDDVLAMVEDEDWPEQMQEYEEDEAIKTAFLEISPDVFHKDNVSGGMSYALKLSKDSSIDAELLFYKSKISFMNYLKSAIEHGGFIGMVDKENQDFQSYLMDVKKALIEF